MFTCNFGNGMFLFANAGFRRSMPRFHELNLVTWATRRPHRVRAIANAMGVSIQMVGSVRPNVVTTRRAIANSEKRCFSTWIHSTKADRTEQLQRLRPKSVAPRIDFDRFALECLDRDCRSAGHPVGGLPPRASYPSSSCQRRNPGAISGFKGSKLPWHARGSFPKH